MTWIEDKMDLLEVKGVGLKNPFTMEMQEIKFTRANYLLMCKAR